MPAYKSKRDGCWRYRKWITLPDGKRTRITGTPAVDTKVAAESAERAHIDRMLHPERVQASAGAAVPKKKELPTVKEFAKRFMEEHRPRQKESERYNKTCILNGFILPFFGAMHLDEIDQSHINGFVGSQTAAKKTVVNRLTVLSTMLRYAGPRGCRLIPETDLRFTVDGGGMSPEIVAVPSADTAKLIAAASDERYRVAVLLASEAGLRIGEIRGLQHTDVRDGQLTVRRAIDRMGNLTTPKHDKRRSVPLSPALVKALENIPRRGLWVLTEQDGSPMLYAHMLEGINALYQHAGVSVPKSDTGVTRPWHSLRHTFGTECAARGVPLPIIRELMGHSSVTTTMRYVTVTGAQLDAAILLAFGQQVGNTPPQNPNDENSRVEKVV